MLFLVIIRFFQSYFVNKFKLLYNYLVYCEPHFFLANFIHEIKFLGLRKFLVEGLIRPGNKILLDLRSTSLSTGSNRLRSNANLKFSKCVLSLLLK